MRPATHSADLAMVLLAVGLALPVTACGGAPAVPATSTPPASSAPLDETVTADLALSTTTLRSGRSATGRIAVQNRTGRAIQVAGCGSIYVVLVVGPNHHPTPSWDLCLRTITIPEGPSTYPVTVMAAYDQCWRPGSAGEPRCLADGSLPGLPPGRYEAVPAGVTAAVPLPAAIAITVTE